jgi:hypothetical protein
MSIDLAVPIEGLLEDACRKDAESCPAEALVSWFDCNRGPSYNGIKREKNRRKLKWKR